MFVECSVLFAVVVCCLVSVGVVAGCSLLLCVVVGGCCFFGAR